MYRVIGMQLLRNKICKDRERLGDRDKSKENKLFFIYILILALWFILGFIQTTYKNLNLVPPSSST